MAEPLEAESKPEKEGDDHHREAEDEEGEFVERDPTGRYGRYNEILGKGAFKTVYRAFDEVDGIEVAWNQVKVEDVLQSSEDLERLYSEVHLLKSLKHKNIIKLYNSWVDTKTKNVNFITEIFTSGTLRQYRKKHKHVDLRAVKNWAKQILRGLLYLHSHNPPIIHRDLKCDNIFVNGNQGEVKIGDLGLAAILRQAHAAHSVIGTPEFMAPELYEEEYNELVDIYSFGMCLLEMVTFEYPYSECTNAAQIYKKVTSGKKPAALEKVKDLEVKAFIEKCLATASKRLPARELLMDPFLQSEGDREPIEVLAPMSRSRSRADDMEGLSTIKEEPSGRPGSVDSCNRRSETSPTREEGSQATEDSRRSEEHSGAPSGSSSPEHLQREDSEQGPGSYQKGVSSREEGKRSRDFVVKGKKKDDDTVFLKVRIADLEGNIRNIHFPFSIEGDTAMSVASEMVAELDLSDQDVTTIAEMIDAAIVALVPEWRPGASFEENNTGGEVPEEQVRGGEEVGPSVSQIVSSEEEQSTGASAAEEQLQQSEAEEQQAIENAGVAADTGQLGMKSRSPRTGPLSYSPRLEGASSSMHGRFEEVTYHPEGFDAPSGSSEAREDGDEWDLTGRVTSPVAPIQGNFCLDVKTEQTPTNLLKIVEQQNIDSDAPGCNEVLVTIKSSGFSPGSEQLVHLEEGFSTEGLQQEDEGHETEEEEEKGEPEPGMGVVDLVASEQDESIARELKLLALRQEQELRELQRKHESALLEIRNRCRCKRGSGGSSEFQQVVASDGAGNLLVATAAAGAAADEEQEVGVATKVLAAAAAGQEVSLDFGGAQEALASSGSSAGGGFDLQRVVCKPDQGFCVFQQDNASGTRVENSR